MPAGKTTRDSCASACSYGANRRLLGVASASAFPRRYNELPLAAPVNNLAPTKTKSACAMVPLNPNELSREGQFASPDRGSTSPGMRNDPDDAIDARCAFSLSRMGAVL